MSVAAMGPVSAARAENRLRAVATFSILGDLLKNACGDRADVTTLVGRDGDVHVYAPTPADAKTLALANLVVVNGLGWLDRLIAVSGSKASVVVASRGIHQRQTTDATEFKPFGQRSTRLAVCCQRRNLCGQYSRRLDRGRSRREGILRGQRRSLSGQARGARQRDQGGHGVNSRRPAQDYNHAQRIRLSRRPLRSSNHRTGRPFHPSRTIGARRCPHHCADPRPKIPAVFLENVTDPRLLQQIAAETAAKIGGTIYSDSLSPPNGPAAIYVDMMHHNARAFQRALTS
jgi:zinc/manganese transport system substrate-binding protein